MNKVNDPQQNVGFLEGVLVATTPGGPTPIRDLDGKPIRRLWPGWAPSYVMKLGEGLSLLVLHHENGTPQGWLLDHDLNKLGRLDVLLRKGANEIAARVAKALHQEFCRSLDYTQLGKDEARPEAPMSNLEPALLRTLIKMGSDDAVNVLRLEDLPQGLLTLTGSSTTLSAFWLMSREMVLRHLCDFVAGLSSPPIHIPRLSGAEPSFTARILPYGARHYALFARDQCNSQPYIRILSINRNRPEDLIYFPFDQTVIICDSEVSDTISARRAVRDLRDWFLKLPQHVQFDTLRPATVCGFLLQNDVHLGHALWEEMYALYRIVQERVRWAAVPYIYVVRGGSGAALYGDLSDIYPELSSCFVYVDSVKEAVEHASKNNVQLYVRFLKGAIEHIRIRGVLRDTRNRMAEMVHHHGREKGLDVAVQRVLGSTSQFQSCPVVVLGLRLSNRRPVDPLGFYVRLTNALVQRFGSVVIVLDGLNREEEQTNTTALIFNGGKKLSRGGDELNEELAFETSYRDACAGLPIQLVSCVGHPIRDNLFWLSQADFFVAPNGAGLAKLRWALDIPGYVLTSRTNLEYCTVVDLYAHPKHTEPPFQPLYMNLPSEVTDEPLDPPRTELPVESSTPHPENFTLDENVVLPRICDLVQLHHKGSGGANKRTA